MMTPSSPRPDYGSLALGSAGGAMGTRRWWWGPSFWIISTIALGCAQSVAPSADSPPTDVGVAKDATPEDTGHALDQGSEHPIDQGLDDVGQVDAEPPDSSTQTLGAFLDPCERGSDCLSGFCVQAEDGLVCTRTCNDDCPDGWVCRENANLSGDPTFICVFEHILCSPCDTPEDCGDPANLCLAIGDGTFCGRDCTTRACPDGYDCVAVQGQDPSVRQCVPSTGWCTDCRDEDHDLHQGGPDCNDSMDCDDHDPDVYQGAPERCNGKDDDCDGATDEGFDLSSDPEHCGSCDRECAFPHGRARCSQGECELAACEEGFVDADLDPSNGCEYECQVTHHGEELCDGLDNDCDGQTDEDFDLQTDPEHCGDCDTVCPTATCAMDGDGYVALGDSLCQGGRCREPERIPCGAYACEFGRDQGDRCARSCQGDDWCAPGAHCEDARCIPDLPDGAACRDGRQCASGYCSNGFCCARGDCCSTALDCPPIYGSAPVCDDPHTCQGHRVDPVCSNHVCQAGPQTPDDSGCGPDVEADPCGPYPSVSCTGEPDQARPTCPIRCVTDLDCDPDAFCEAGRCVPDRGPGGQCTGPGACQPGLYCVDGVCCTSRCDGRCERCDLTEDGTCAPVPHGMDPDEECLGTSCAGFFWGWEGDACFARLDLQDWQVGCDGRGQCQRAQDLCPDQPKGPVASTCHPDCQEPMGGTCQGMTPGSCIDTNPGTTSCGVGECSRTVPVCVNGAPNQCVPGRPSPEVCDALDNDCDGSTDEGLAGDVYESDDSCGGRRALAAQVSGDPSTTITATIYPAGDADFYVFRAQEDDDNSCECCDWACLDEDFRATVYLTPPPGKRYRLCVDGSCVSGSGGNCVDVTGPNTASRSFTFDGSCCPGGCSDSHDVHVKVLGLSGSHDCHPYTLTYRVEQGCY